MIIERFGKPVVSKSAFVADTAAVIGEVEIKEEASIWYGAVLRGDMGKIIVEKMANVQDNVVIHSEQDFPVIIGEQTSIGHGAVIHGCQIGRGSLIGMGAVVLSHAVVGERCIIGAGAVVKEGDHIPDGSLVVGVPGKVVRQLTEEQAKGIETNAEEYCELSRKYLER